MEVGVLRVNNLRLIGNHGFYEEERILGGMYQIDVTIKFEMTQNVVDLDGTINYEMVCDIVKNMMKKSCRLIEELAQSIYFALTDLAQNVIQISVTVTKLNVPIPHVGSTSFTLTSEK